jgi:plasmid maintenance system antidote protein VapI
MSPAIRHPGAVLREDFLVPVAEEYWHVWLRTNIPIEALRDLVREKPGAKITPYMATELGRYYRLDRQFFVNLQDSYDRSHPG